MAMSHRLRWMRQQLDPLSTLRNRIDLDPVGYPQQKEELRFLTPSPISSGIGVCKGLLLGTRATLTYKWSARWHAKKLRSLHAITPWTWCGSRSRQGSASEALTAEPARRGRHAGI
jgi:hypothetical protein